MPGNRLSFPVGVGRQKYFSGIPGGFFKSPDNFAFAGNGAVFWFKRIININSDFPGRKIFNVPYGGGNIKFIAEIFIDCSYFCR